MARAEFAVRELQSAVYSALIMFGFYDDIAVNGFAVAVRIVGSLGARGVARFSM